VRVTASFLRPCSERDAIRQGGSRITTAAPTLDDFPGALPCHRWIQALVTDVIKTFLSPHKRAMVEPAVPALPTGSFDARLRDRA
jgi:hypothetical protein